jgi:hypothetical protein
LAKVSRARTPSLERQQWKCIMEKQKILLTTDNCLTFSSNLWIFHVFTCLEAFIIKISLHLSLLLLTSPVVFSLLFHYWKVFSTTTTTTAQRYNKEEIIVNYCENVGWKQNEDLKSFLLILFGISQALKCKIKKQKFFYTYSIKMSYTILIKFGLKLHLCSLPVTVGCNANKFSPNL